MAKGPLDDVQNAEMDWFADAGDINQDTIEIEEAGYPVLQWVNGEKKLKQLGNDNVFYTGGLWLSKKYVDEEAVDGWTPATWDHGGKEEEEGFFCQRADIAVVHHRRCWEVSSNERKNRFTWDKYDEAGQMGRQSSRVHVLARVKGLENISDLFVITIKGTVAKEIRGTATHTGLLQKFQRYVVDGVNKEIKKRGQTNIFPRYVFWMPIGTNFDAKGAPVFTTVGKGDKSSDITLPVLIGVDEKMTLDALRGFYVGKALAMELMKLYQDTKDWAEAWDEIVPDDADYEAVDDAPEDEPDESELISEDDTFTPEQGALVDRF